MDKVEAEQIMAELHNGTFGTHSSGHTMAKKILRAGYYWSTMEADCHLLNDLLNIFVHSFNSTVHLWLIGR